MLFALNQQQSTESFEPNSSRQVATLDTLAHLPASGCAATALGCSVVGCSVVGRMPPQPRDPFEPHQGRSAARRRSCPAAAQLLQHVSEGGVGKSAATKLEESSKQIGKRNSTAQNSVVLLSNRCALQLKHHRSSRYYIAGTRFRRSYPQEHNKAVVRTCCNAQAIKLHVNTSPVPVVSCTSTLKMAALPANCTSRPDILRGESCISSHIEHGSKCRMVSRAQCTRACCWQTGRLERT